MKYCIVVWSPQLVSDTILLDEIQKCFISSVVHSDYLAKSKIFYPSTWTRFNIKRLNSIRISVSGIVLFPDVLFPTVFERVLKHERGERMFQRARNTCIINIVLNTFHYHVVDAWNIVPRAFPDRLSRWCWKLYETTKSFWFLLSCGILVLNTPSAYILVAVVRFPSFTNFTSIFFVWTLFIRCAFLSFLTPRSLLLPIFRCLSAIYVCLNR